MTYEIGAAVWKAGEGQLADGQASLIRKSWQMSVMRKLPFFVSDMQNSDICRICHFGSCGCMFLEAGQVIILKVTTNRFVALTFVRFAL